MSQLSTSTLKVHPGIGYDEVMEVCEDCDDDFFLRVIPMSFPTFPPQPIGGMTAKDYYLLLHSVYGVDYGSENYLNLQVCVDRAIRKGDSDLLKYFLDIAEETGNTNIKIKSNVAGYYLTKEQLPLVPKNADSAIESGILKYKDITIIEKQSLYIISSPDYRDAEGDRLRMLILLTCGGGEEQARLFQQQFPERLEGMFPMIAYNIAQEEAILYGLIIRGDYNAYLAFTYGKSLNLDIISDMIRLYDVAPNNWDIIKHLLTTNTRSIDDLLYRIIITMLTQFSVRMLDPVYAKISEDTLGKIIKNYFTSGFFMDIPPILHTPFALQLMDVIHNREIARDFSIFAYLISVNNPIILARAIIEKGYGTYESILGLYITVFVNWLTNLVNQSPAQKVIPPVISIPKNVLGFGSITYAINGKKRVVNLTSDSKTVKDLLILIRKRIFFTDEQQLIAKSLPRGTRLKDGMAITIVSEDVHHPSEKEVYYAVNAERIFYPGDQVIVRYDVGSIRVAEFVSLNDNVVVYYANNDITIRIEDLIGKYKHLEHI